MRIDCTRILSLILLGFWLCRLLLRLLLLLGLSLALLHLAVNNVVGLVGLLRVLLLVCLTTLNVVVVTLLVAILTITTSTAATATSTSGLLTFGLILSIFSALLSWSLVLLLVAAALRLTLDRVSVLVDSWGTRDWVTIRVELGATRDWVTILIKLRLTRLSLLLLSWLVLFGLLRGGLLGGICDSSVGSIGRLRTELNVVIVLLFDDMLFILSLLFGTCEHLGSLREVNAGLLLHGLQILNLVILVVATSVELRLATLFVSAMRLRLALLSLFFPLNFGLLHHFVVGVSLLISVLHEDALLFHVKDFQGDATIQN